MGSLAGIGCFPSGVDAPADDPADASSNGSDDGSTDGADDGSTDGADDELPDDGLELGFSIVVESMPVHRPVLGAWPAAAFGGTSYLVVWEDHRRRRPTLYGGRVTADGTALDPFGFQILDVVPEVVDGSAYQPDVAFDGENFLVVASAGGPIRGVRVSPTGKVLDPSGFLIADPDGTSPPSLAFDGQQYLVAWSQSGSGVMRARVQPDGTVIDPGGVFVHESDDMPVGVSFDGTNTLLSWLAIDLEHIRSVYAGRITADGTLLDDPPLRLSSEGERVDHQCARFDGTNHVIAWNSYDDEIRASRVTPDGTLLDPDGFLVDELGYTKVHRLDMAVGSGHSIVVWSAHYSEPELPDSADPVRAAQIATDGTTIVYPDDTFSPGLEAMVATHPDGALLLWRDGDSRLPDYPQIVGTRLDAASMPVPGSVVAPASPASRQDVKSIASDGQNFFVLWTDARDPISQGQALYGARVGADGTSLDPESLQLTTMSVDDAHVVFDGANFVVTWVDDSDSSRAVRVNPAGVRLDEAPLNLPLCDDLAGASDGTFTLMVGVQCSGGNNRFALLLDHEGAVASDLIQASGPSAFDAAVSFNGTNYLVVGVGLGQRITQAGALEGQPFPLIAAGAHHVNLAGGGGLHLAVWENDVGIWAARVSSDGQVLDPGGRLVTALENESPIWVCNQAPDRNTCGESSVVFDGENFVVAWRQQSIPGHPNSLDVYAATVSPAGEVSPRFMISQAPENEGAPFLASGASGVLAAFTRFVPGPPYDTRRAVATLMD